MKPSGSASWARRLLAIWERSRVILVGALVLGAGGDVAPTTADLRELVSDAVALETRERGEEFLDAYERGEDHEHVFVLQEDIDRERYDHDALFRIGDALFDHEFRAEEGFGDREDAPLRRVHDGARGGLDTFSCSGCHSVGGLDGAGGPTQTAFMDGDGEHLSSAVARNPPAVLGLGVVQALGAEMSRALMRQRDEAKAEAERSGRPVTVDLSAKGVGFGRIGVDRDGNLDASLLDGVSSDLVVRPFGWKGTIARLRRFVEDASRVHFGIQSHVLALGHQRRPDPLHLGSSPSWWDPDGDGVQRELEEGSITATAVYLTMLESPVVLPPTRPDRLARHERGRALFSDLGCASCHRPSLHLDEPLWHEYADTTAGSVEVDLLRDGDSPRSTADVELFSDLKRHDLGAELADPHDSEGVRRTVFLTRPLWGLAETAPYLHDGRAATIPDAITAHGGEAKPARDAFLAASAEDRASLHVFLLSLTREPKVRVAR